MLRHIPNLAQNFLFISFSFLVFSSLLSIRKFSSAVSIYKMEKSLGSPAFFRPIAFIFYVSMLCERIILNGILSSLIQFSLPARPVSAPVVLLLIKFFIFLCLFRASVTNPALELSLPLLTFVGLLTLSGILLFFISLFLLVSLLASFDEFFLAGPLAWFSKITLSRSF